MLSHSYHLGIGTSTKQQEVCEKKSHQQLSGWPWYDHLQPPWSLGGKQLVARGYLIYNYLYINVTFYVCKCNSIIQ